MKLGDLQHWFKENAEQSANAFWSLKGDGKYRGNNLVVGDTDTSWMKLERLIMDLNSNGGVRNFEITFKASKTDASKLTYTHKFPFVAGSGETKGIAGIQGIGQILQMQSQLTESKIATIEARHQAELDRRDAALLAKEERDLLEARIYTLESGGQSAFDKIWEKIEESPKIQGMLQPFIAGLAGSMFPPVSIGAMPNGATVTRPAASVPTTDTAQNGDAAVDDEVQEDEGCDFNLVVKSAMMMQQAGIKGADDKLYKIAYVAAVNPAMFEQQFAQIDAAYTAIVNQQNNADE